MLLYKILVPKTVKNLRDSFLRLVQTRVSATEGQNNLRNRSTGFALTDSIVDVHLGFLWQLTNTYKQSSLAAPKELDHVFQSS